MSAPDAEVFVNGKPFDATTRALAHDPGREASERDAWIAFMAAALQSEKVVRVGEVMTADPTGAEEAARIADDALAQLRTRWPRP